VLYSYCASPVGRLLLTGDGNVLTGLYFTTGKKARGANRLWRRNDRVFAVAQRQLHGYFAGERKVFDLPIKPEATPFQASVLEELQRIPYGEVRSYADIADAVGNPKAARAVGNANGNNPIAIIIPCHRVVGSNGSLTGFGGGLDSKRYLLDLEHSHSGLFA
jgi:methylated-DNA-[protein]-cysteine S-methyltransferase